MNWALSHLATGRALQDEWYKMEGVSRKMGGERELLTKEKIKLFLAWTFLWGKRMGSVFTLQIALWYLTRIFHTGYLTLCFWERLKLQLDQGWYHGLLAQVMAFWACGFLFNTPSTYLM